eukprot:m.28892 g.28892  ORF g.28892 m.28892 type:complete len:415 (+) comp6101_c0_seq1:42-1286(+)
MSDDDDDVMVVGETINKQRSTSNEAKRRKDSFLKEGIDDFIPLDIGNDYSNPQKKQKAADHHKKKTRRKKRGEDFGAYDVHPWLMGKTLSQIPIIALHEEVRYFMEYMRPTPEEEQLRKEVVKNIEDVIYGLWPKSEVCVFGSYKTDLYLPTSDIDIVVHGSWPALPLNTLAHALENANIPDRMEVIAKARVPIVKFRDERSQIHVDISFNQPSGPADAESIIRWKKEYIHAEPLVMVVKQFLLQRDLNEPFHGGIGSFAIFLLVMSFLQRRTVRVPAESCNLGVLLIEFFELYGKQFHYGRVGIRVNGNGSYFDKVTKGWVNRRQTEVMSIENPSNPDHDVTGNAFATPAIQEVFAHAYAVLSCCMYERRPKDYIVPRSLLGEILSVNEETQEYRQWVKETWGMTHPSKSNEE